MRVRVSTELPLTMDQTWGLMKPETLRQITRGWVSWVGEMPEEVKTGDVVHVGLKLFGFMPAYDYELRMEKVDRAAGRIVSQERGGLVRSWRHEISIDPVGEGRVRHTDDIEFDAGIMTPVVWALSSLIYRSRQARERRIAAAMAQAS